MALKNPMPTPSWKTLFDAIEDGICVQSLDSHIVRANRAFAAIIGSPLEQIIGRTCAEVFGCGNETGAIPQFCARSVSGEKGYAAEDTTVTIMATEGPRQIANQLNEGPEDVLMSFAVAMRMPSTFIVGKGGQGIDRRTEAEVGNVFPRQGLFQHPAD